MATTRNPREPANNVCSRVVQSVATRLVVNDSSTAINNTACADKAARNITQLKESKNPNNFMLINNSPGCNCPEREVIAERSKTGKYYFISLISC